MKRVKLAVIRNNSDIPCPFGLNIPNACKTVGDLIEKMAPKEILGEKPDPEEVHALFEANRNLYAWRSPNAPCAHSGGIVKNKMVECNFGSKGIGGASFHPAPYYTKVYNNTAYDDLFSYPVGYYADANISRNLYYSIYSLNSEEEREQLVKISNEFIKMLVES